MKNLLSILVLLFSLSTLAQPPEFSNDKETYYISSVGGKVMKGTITVMYDKGIVEFREFKTMKNGRVKTHTMKLFIETMEEFDSKGYEVIKFKNSNLNIVINYDKRNIFYYRKGRILTELKVNKVVFDDLDTKGCRVISVNGVDSIDSYVYESDGFPKSLIIKTDNEFLKFENVIPGDVMEEYYTLYSNDDNFRFDFYEYDILVYSKNSDGDEWVELYDIKLESVNKKI